MTAASLIRAGEPVPCRPWPRFILSQGAWFDMAHALPLDPTLAFTALWADPTHVHALFQSDTPLLASVAVEAGLYAALSPTRPGASLFERAVSDLWGHQAADAIDVRPWLDHGTWPTLRPLGSRPVPNASLANEPEPPEMLAAPGDRIAIGPLMPTLAAPAHWRITLAGGTVHRLEARLGWSHRGILGLMRGKSPTNAARLAARIDGAATVAHATAFARAVEAALDTPPPPAAAALRELLLALERIAMALHDLHAAGGAPVYLATVAKARETLLDACFTFTGHRLMMDTIRPGGVSIDPASPALAALDAVLAALPGPLARHLALLGHAWPGSCALSLPDALSLGVPGPFGRASGRPDPVQPDAPLLTAGTAAARLRLRATALAADIETARNQLANIPKGPTQAPLPHAAAEGLASANGPTGPVWHWVRLSNGTVAANFAAAPEWLHVPAAERAAPGLDPAHLPILAASFALRPSGMDL